MEPWMRARSISRKSIPKFNGEGDAYWWLICIGNYFDATGTPETEKLSEAVMALQKGALQWWQQWSLRHPQTTWRTFGIALLWHYKSEDRDILPDILPMLPKSVQVIPEIVQQLQNSVMQLQNSIQGIQTAVAEQDNQRSNLRHNEQIPGRHDRRCLWHNEHHDWHDGSYGSYEIGQKCYHGSYGTYWDRIHDSESQGSYETQRGKLEEPECCGGYQGRNNDSYCFRAGHHNNNVNFGQNDDWDETGGSFDGNNNYGQYSVREEPWRKLETHVFEGNSTEEILKQFGPEIDSVANQEFGQQIDSIENQESRLVVKSRKGSKTQKQPWSKQKKGAKKKILMKKKAKKILVFDYSKVKAKAMNCKENEEKEGKTNSVDYHCKRSNLLGCLFFQQWDPGGHLLIHLEDKVKV